MKIATFLFSCLAAFCSSAQDDIYAIMEHNTVLRLSPGQCTTEELVYVQANDIAIEGDVLYGCLMNVFRIDPYTGQTQDITGQIVSPYGVIGATGLVGDGNGNLIMGAAEILRYNIATGTTEVMGDLYAEGYVVSGDLEFRDGRLYASAYSFSNDSVDVIVEIGLNPFSVTEVLALPGICYGMAGADLPQNLVYLGIGPDLYTLDLLTQELVLMCADVVAPTIKIYGLAYGDGPLLPLGIDEVSAAVPTVSQQFETGMVTIELPMQLVGETYRLFNAAGQLTKEGTLTEVTTLLDVNGIAAGMYQLEIGREQRSSHHRVIVFD